MGKGDHQRLRPPPPSLNDDDSAVLLAIAIVGLCRDYKLTLAYMENSYPNVYFVFVSR